MAHFALLWKARTIEKYRQNYENEKYLSLQNTNTPMPQKSLSQRLRCYRQDTKKRFSRIFQKIYPEGSSLSNFFLYLRTDQTCLHFILKSLLGFLIGLGLTYLCFLFLMFQLSISLFHATVVSSIIGVLLTMGLAFSYRIRCLIFLLLPQFFSRAGRYTLTCYALVLILTGPATNTLKNSEVLSESMACRQEQIKSLVNVVKETLRKPLNSMRDSIKIMVKKINLFASQLKQTLLKVNRLTLSVLDSIQSTFSWLQWLSTVCNKLMGTPFQRCKKVLKEGVFDYKRKLHLDIAQIRRLANKAEEICSNVKHYKAICVFTDFVNGSFVTSIKRRLRDFSERIRNMLYLQIHVHHSYSFSSNSSNSASQVAAGIVTEIRKRADPLLTWLSWSSCVTSLFLLLIIFRAKYYQHMFETRSRFDNKYITKELRDLDLKRLRHGRETILPLNRRERSKYVSTTSFRLVASEKIHLNRSIVFMAITTFKLLIHMVADYSLYWVLMTIRYHGNNQTPLPFGVPDAGMHITGKGRIAYMFRSLLGALTSPLETPPPLSNACLPDPHPPNLKRYTQIGILIFLLWFFALFEPYGLRLRHVIVGLYRPERARARAEWLYNHILRTRGGFMKFARRKLHRSYKYSTEEKYTFKRWLNEHIPFCWIRCLLGISSEEHHCLLCGAKEDSKDPNTKLQKCYTRGCPGVYCCSCFSDIGELCTICLSPSDYGDLSDVSLEKGSSDDESADESQGNQDKVDPNNGDKNNEEDTFEYESDIILPEPMRDKNQEVNHASARDLTPFKSNMTKFSKFKGEIFDYPQQPQDSFEYKQTETHFKKNRLSGLVLVNTTYFLAHFDYKMSVKSKVHKYNKTQKTFVRHIEHLHNSKKLLSNVEHERKQHFKINNFTVRFITNNSGGDNQKHSRKRQDRPTTTDTNGKDDRKGNESDKIGDNTERNIKQSNKSDDNDNPKARDEVDKNEQALTSTCCFKLFNSVLCSCWRSLKNNLYNGLSTLAVGNNTLNSDKNNFKTRKKDSLELYKKTKTVHKDSKDPRQYRIFTFLAEQEWVIKKTISYENTEKEFSLINEGRDIKTIENKNLHSQNFCFPNKRNEFIKLNPVSTQILVCEDCKHNCLCPENPLNKVDEIRLPSRRVTSDDAIAIRKSNSNSTNESGFPKGGIVITQLPPGCTENDIKPKAGCKRQKLFGCFKMFLYSNKNCNMVEEEPRMSCKTKANSKSKPKARSKDTTHCPCKDTVIQYDKNDCASHNIAIQVGKRKNIHNQGKKIERGYKDHLSYDQQEKEDKCGPLYCPHSINVDHWGTKDHDLSSDDNNLRHDQRKKEKCAPCFPNHAKNVDKSSSIDRLHTSNTVHNDNFYHNKSKKKENNVPYFPNQAKIDRMKHDLPSDTEHSDNYYHDEQRKKKKCSPSFPNQAKNLEKSGFLGHDVPSDTEHYDNFYHNEQKKKEKCAPRFPNQAKNVDKSGSIHHDVQGDREHYESYYHKEQKRKEKRAPRFPNQAKNVDKSGSMHHDVQDDREHNENYYHKEQKRKEKCGPLYCPRLINVDNWGSVDHDRSSVEEHYDNLCHDQRNKRKKYGPFYNNQSQFGKRGRPVNNHPKNKEKCDCLIRECGVTSPMEIKTKDRVLMKEEKYILSPRDCKCNNYGNPIKKYDNLCPEECCCNSEIIRNDNAHLLAQNHIKLTSSVGKKIKDDNIDSEIKQTCNGNKAKSNRAKIKDVIEEQCECSDNSTHDFHVKSQNVKSTKTKGNHVIKVQCDCSDNGTDDFHVNSQNVKSTKTKGKNVIKVQCECSDNGTDDFHINSQIVKSTKTKGKHVIEIQRECSANSTDDFHVNSQNLNSCKAKGKNLKEVQDEFSDNSIDDRHVNSQNVQSTKAKGKNVMEVQGEFSDSSIDDRHVNSQNVQSTKAKGKNVVEVQGEFSDTCIDDRHVNSQNVQSTKAKGKNLKEVQGEFSDNSIDDRHVNSQNVQSTKAKGKNVIVQSEFSDNSIDDLHVNSHNVNSSKAKENNVIEVQGEFSDNSIDDLHVNSHNVNSSIAKGKNVIEVQGEFSDNSINDCHVNSHNVNSYKAKGKNVIEVQGEFSDNSIDDLHVNSHNVNSSKAKGKNVIEVQGEFSDNSINDCHVNSHNVNSCKAKGNNVIEVQDEFSNSSIDDRHVNSLNVKSTKAKIMKAKEVQCEGVNTCHVNCKNITKPKAKNKKAKKVQCECPKNGVETCRGDCKNIKTAKSKRKKGKEVVCKFTNANTDMNTSHGDIKSAKTKNNNIIKLQCYCADASDVDSYHDDSDNSDKKLCSCAVQCELQMDSVGPKPTELRVSSSCLSSGCTISVTILSNDTSGSDYTGTDHLVGLAYLGRHRIRGLNYSRITKCDQCNGTETATKNNVGTITIEKGLIRDNRFTFNKIPQRITENRGVSTKKLVTFTSRVHIIPGYSHTSSSDIYTPSRYLLESQKYYNELFAMNPYMPQIYLMKAIQNKSRKRTSPQGSTRSVDQDVLEENAKCRRTYVHKRCCIISKKIKKEIS